MNNESRYIQAGKEKLHYLEWGNGKRLLLAFHGYEDDAEMFNPLQQYLSEEYTILSFDLPHHGKSKWSEDTQLTKQELMALVESLKITYNVSKVSLLGYSMGGRVCLTIIACLPASIDKVVLIASDGLTQNSYYYFFTHNYFGKKIFRNLLDRPMPYFRLMNLLKKMRLVNASRHKFAMHFLQTEKSRKFLLHVWIGMSDIMPGPVKLRMAIRRYAIPISIFMGFYDKIIPPSMAEKFKSGLDTVQLFILEKGHRVFDNETAQQIAERF